MKIIPIILTVFIFVSCSDDNNQEQTSNGEINKTVVKEEQAEAVSEDKTGQIETVEVTGETDEEAPQKVRNPDRPVLRVCADPALMPFSNKDEEGFENKIAEFLAEKINADLAYEWFPQRIGFIRNTLRSEVNGKYKCDLVMSVPEHFELSATTKPYYASSSALVYIKGRGLDHVTSPELLTAEKENGERIKFGLFDRGSAQLWLFKQGLMTTMTPYQFQLGDANANPTEIILNDLYDGKIDVTLVSGPFAGYFSKKNSDRGEMVILPVKEDPSDPRMRFVFNMSMGVRHGDNEWKEQLNDLIDKHQAEINTIIASFGIPIIEVIPKPAPEDDD